MPYEISITSGFELLLAYAALVANIGLLYHLNDYISWEFFPAALASSGLILSALVLFKILATRKKKIV